MVTKLAMILTGTKASSRLICACADFVNFRHMKKGEKRERAREKHRVGISRANKLQICDERSLSSQICDRFGDCFFSVGNLRRIYFPSEICDELFSVANLRRFFFHRKFAMVFYFHH